MTITINITKSENNNENEGVSEQTHNSTRRICTDWMHCEDTTRDQGYCPGTGGSCHGWCFDCPYT